MTTDLKDQIHILMERGIQPVSAADIARQPVRATPFRAKEARPGLHRSRTAVIATGVAAAACAAGLVAAQSGGSGRPAEPAARHEGRAVLTAAMIRHLATASQLALAHSGEAVIRLRQYQDGVLEQTSADDITFSGRNWNDSFTVASPAGEGQPASRESAINRVVDGQAYDYFIASDGLAWYHEVGPDAISSMNIPDPRKLLAELAPGAGFVKLGLSVIGGVHVEHLQATALSRLPVIQIPDLWNAGRLTALDFWVDGNGVVRQMSLSFKQTSYSAAVSLNLKHLPKGTKVVGLRYLRNPAKARVDVVLKKAGGKVIVEIAPDRSARPQTQVTSLAVDFTDIGQPQIIRAPAYAIRVYGRG